MIQSVYKLEPVMDTNVRTQYVSPSNNVDLDQYFDWMDKTLGLSPVQGNYSKKSVPVLPANWLQYPIRVANLDTTNSDHLWWPPYSHVYSSRGVEVLNNILAKEGQLHSISCVDRNDLYYYQLKTFANVLDTKRSVCNWIGKSAVSVIYEHHFVFPDIWNHHIFYLQQEGLTHYVTDAFKDLVESNGLRGFVFDEVWHRDAKNSSP